MQFGVGDAGKTGSQFVSLFMVLVSLGFLCSCGDAPVAEQPTSPSPPPTEPTDPFMPPISKERALSILQQYFRVSPGDIRLASQNRLVFFPDQLNEVACIDYIDQRFDQHVVDFFLIRADGNPDRLLRHRAPSSSTSRGYGFRVLDFAGKRHLVVWSVGGSAHYLGITVYEYLPVGAMQAVWKNPEGGMMGANARISEGMFFVNCGGGNYNKLVRKDGEFRLVDKHLRYDLDSAPWLHYIDFQRETLEVDASTAPYHFRFSGRRLTMTETPGKQAEYELPWKHYTVENISLQPGQLLVVRPKNGLHPAGLRVRTYGNSLLERKPGTPRTYLAKEAGNAVLTVEDYKTTTYRFDVEIVGEDDGHGNGNR